MPYIDNQGQYYEGEQASLEDIEVPVRPSIYHIYNAKLKEWVIDDNKVLELKKMVLQKLDEELEVKMKLFHLTDQEKRLLQDKYDKCIDILSTCNDPSVIESLSI